MHVAFPTLLVEEEDEEEEEEEEEARDGWVSVYYCSPLHPHGQFDPAKKPQKPKNHTIAKASVK